LIEGILAKACFRASGEIRPE